MDTGFHLQIDYYCRLDCLWKKKFKKEHEEFETMENVNRLLLENVLPAHVAAYFIGDKLNEVLWEEGAQHVVRRLKVQTQSLGASAELLSAGFAVLGLGLCSTCPGDSLWW